MNVKRLALLLVPIAVMANTCTPTQTGGYAIRQQLAGGITSMTFAADATDPALYLRVIAVVDEINRLTGSSHVVTGTDPGPTVVHSVVRRVDSASNYCAPHAVGCNIATMALASDGKLHPTGGDIYVQIPDGDLDFFGRVIAHEIAHSLGLDHFDPMITDSSGALTAQRMCGGPDAVATGCATSNVILQSGSNYYAEGDVRGLKALVTGAVPNSAFNPFGSFDGVSATGGTVTVAGWTIDAEAVAGNEVHAYVYRPDQSIVVARNLGNSVGVRSDVGATYPWAGSNHGFNGVVGTVGPGTYNVCVYGINTGFGGNVSLGCKAINV